MEARTDFCMRLQRWINVTLCSCSLLFALSVTKELPSLRASLTVQNGNEWKVKRFQRKVIKFNDPDEAMLFVFFSKAFKCTPTITRCQTNVSFGERT